MGTTKKYVRSKLSEEKPGSICRRHKIGINFKVPVTTRILLKDFDKFWVVTGTDF